jgi:hypothetical protein
MFVGTLAGLLALTFITKLQFEPNFVKLTVINALLSSLYPTYFVPGLGFNDEADIKLLTIFLILLATLWS